MFDFAIVGAGMAGASLAAELAPHASVLLLEAEDTPGYHSTGRSAAFWDECYGGPAVVPLTLASGAFLREQGLLGQRGSFYIGRDEDSDQIDGFLAEFGATGATIERVSRAEMAERIPGLRPQWTQAVWAPNCADIDVAGLHALFLQRARAAGVTIENRARIGHAALSDGQWAIDAQGGASWAAKYLINAAGAWADPLAQMCGLGSLGIQPYRRTVSQLRIDPPAPAELPLVIDISGNFYFKPDNGRLWLSPQDETPSDPVDAAPEELDVAMAIAGLETVTDWRIESVERKWAGLRSFAPDRRPVFGRDPRCPQFIWFAGQGGFGIQTAPASARMMAQRLLGQDRDAMTANLDAEIYAPDRLL